MKYLHDYIDQAQTDLFNETSSFFAFSSKQVAEGIGHKTDIKYINIGNGLFTPEDKAQQVIDSLENIYKEGIKRDVADNGLRAIIRRELGNHEAQISMDLDDTRRALKDYPITLADIELEWPDFFKMCIDNDYF